MVSRNLASEARHHIPNWLGGTRGDAPHEVDPETLGPGNFCVPPNATPKPSRGR